LSRPRLETEQYLNSGNCNNVEATLDGCSYRHTVWKTPLALTHDTLHGAQGHGDLGWILSCQVATLAALRWRARLSFCMLLLIEHYKNILVCCSEHSILAYTRAR